MSRVSGKSREKARNVDYRPCFSSNDTTTNAKSGLGQTPRQENLFPRSRECLWIQIQVGLKDNSTVVRVKTPGWDGRALEHAKRLRSRGYLCLSG